MEDAYNNGGKITGISTGFKELDDATNGFQNSDLIIVGARPSVGKTALGVNFSEHMSIKNDLPGLIVSREMSTDAIIRRMICTGARVDLMQGMRGTFKEAQFFDIAASAGKIGASRLMIDDRELNIQQIRAEARRQKRRNGIKYLMVDYIQLINSPGHDGRTSEVEHVCNQLKACAKELDIPVIALAQINRESDKDKNNTRPQMHQLKGSGALEQDADLIILLHRAKEAVDEDAEAIIAKQRNGPLKIIPLRFQGSITRFTEKY
jgi:replicative DNA helicase